MENSEKQTHLEENNSEAVTMPANADTDVNLVDMKECKTNDAEEANESSNAKVATGIPVISLSDSEDVPEVPPPKAKKNKRIFDTLNIDEASFLKRRKLNVTGAPKLPVSGYVRYMNERRSGLTKLHPNKTNNELIKIIAEEWQALTAAQKAPYIKAAEAEKEKYMDELDEFLKKHPDVLANELAKSRRIGGVHNDSKSVLKEKHSNGNAKSGKDSGKEKGRHDLNKNFKTPSPPNPTTRKSPLLTAALSSSTPNSISEKLPKSHKRTPTPPIGSESLQSMPFVNPGEIPIFTNEFLEHNKGLDMELRTLRKSKADLEQQNAVLEKHVENMRAGVEKMTAENDELEEKNRLLEIYLEKLKHKLAQALAGLSIPSEPNGATIDNIEKYMQDLHKMATSNTHGPACLNKARDIIRKLDLQIQL